MPRNNIEVAELRRIRRLVLLRAPTVQRRVRIVLLHAPTVRGLAGIAPLPTRAVRHRVRISSGRVSIARTCSAAAACTIVAA